jgi:hypothetical protein
VITTDHLAKLKIKHIIFHDVPKNPKTNQGSPTLADDETEIDSQRSTMLKNRLIRALGSKSAYEIEFNPESNSPVPDKTQHFTNGTYNMADFVDLSQEFAKFLFGEQTGQMSPGLLCVISVVSGGAMAWLF